MRRLQGDERGRPIPRKESPAWQSSRNRRQSIFGGLSDESFDFVLPDGGSNDDHRARTVTTATTATRTTATTRAASIPLALRRNAHLCQARAACVSRVRGLTRENRTKRGVDWSAERQGYLVEWPRWRSRNNQVRSGQPPGTRKSKALSFSSSCTDAMETGIATLHRICSNIQADSRAVIWIDFFPARNIISELIDTIKK